MEHTKQRSASKILLVALLAFFIMLAMVFAMLPTADLTAHADEEKTTVNLSDIKSAYTAQDGETFTGTLSARIKFTVADGATITLKDAAVNGINGVDCAWAGITCLGDATIVLEGTNFVQGYNDSYPGIYVPENKTLTIKGAGTLSSQSNGRAAGIGAGEKNSCGNITIESGRIYALGGSNSAGIGGSDCHGCGDITITGGYVYAQAAEKYAAAIGGGSESSCGNITITGGSVYAEAGVHTAAAIGCGKSGPGGRNATSCGNITIENVTMLVAISKNDSNRIGKGDRFSSCGTVTVRGVNGEVSNDYYYPSTTHTITYNLNDGSFKGLYEKIYCEGVALQLPSNAQKAHYAFAGWYDNEELTGEAVTEIPSNAKEDKVYWAKWEDIFHTITYHLNEGEINGEYATTFQEGVGVTLPSDVTKADNLFVGWFNNEGLTGNAITAIDGNVASDVELWASWYYVSAEEVTELINDIGEVTYTEACEAKIAEARKKYDVLSNEQKEKIDSETLQKLVDAEAEFATAKAEAEAAAQKEETDRQAAEEVKALINAIGEVTYTEECKEKIDAAKEAFGNLTDDQKNLVGNVNVLVYAQQDYQILEATALIDAIGEVTYTEECKAKIDAAKAAYDALGKLQESIENYDKLTDAEAAYDVLKADNEAAEAVTKKINAIGAVTYTAENKGKIDEAKAAYEALTPAQKKLVNNVNTLTTAETTYAAMKTDNEAAAAVIAKINAIDASNPDSEKIAEARTAYNALTADQKALVNNYSALTTAEEKTAVVVTPEKKSLSGGAIAGVVIALAIVLSAIGLLVFNYLKQRKSKKK